jgi:hypothetical protein
MADKIPRRQSSPASAPSTGRTSGRARAEATSAETLAILHPERQLVVAERTLEVREYGFIEGLKLQSGCKGFLDGLFGLFAPPAEPPSLEAIADVMAEHIITVQWMIAQAITPLYDDPEEFVAAVASNARWIGRLPEEAGDLLTACWWEVNKGFFTRRLQRRALAASAARAAAGPSASSASTTP